MNSNSKLYERLEVEERFLDKDGFDYLIRSVLEPASRPEGVPIQKMSAVSGSSTGAYFYYIIENFEEAKLLGERVVDKSLDYFFGDWREDTLIRNAPPDSMWNKRNAPWHTEFRESILWATCLEQWDKAKKIAQYPTRECNSKQAKHHPETSYPLILAAVFRGESLDTVQDLINNVEKGVKKKEKLLLSVLLTIVDENKEAFEKNFLEYLKYYKKRETPELGFKSKLTIDGTILFNLARHKGLDVEFPEQYKDHFICLEQNKQG